MSDVTKNFFKAIVIKKKKKKKRYCTASLFFNLSFTYGTVVLGSFVGVLNEYSL